MLEIKACILNHLLQTKKPALGLVTLSYQVINQNNEVVLSTRGKYLIQTRHS